MALRILLVDDEPVARQILREELAETADVEIAGEAENGEQALLAIHEKRPDLVFLDLQMPGMGGFEVIANLEAASKNFAPSIVVVTAFDQHAIQAFEAGAVDYLLKPVRSERLAKCVERVRQTRKTHQQAGQMDTLHEIALQQQPGPPRKIVAKSGGEFHLLDINQVLAFQAERELVWIITRKQRYLATQNLRQLTQKLAGSRFARIHRNTLVNLDHVAKMAPMSSQRWLLTLSNAQEFIVSKRQAGIVQKLLSG